MMDFGKIIVILTAFFVASGGFTINKARFFETSSNEALLTLKREFTDIYSNPNLSRDHKQELSNLWANVSQVFESVWNEKSANFESYGRLKPDPDAKMNSSELITSKGFKAEEHHVTTADGYILLIVRIISPKPKPDRLPVFMMHGLLSSSDCFINNLRNESLGFILADHGYDVWLGNIRGNRYTTRHVHLQPDDRKFWKWSFDEMAKYDIPVMVDYVLSKTGHQKLNYIGHSEGTTNLITSVVANGKPMEIRINKFIALAPAIYVSHSKGMLRVLSNHARIIQAVYSLVSKGDFFAHKGLIGLFAEKYCYDIPYLCSAVVHTMVGTGLHHFNMSRTPVYLSHAPAGTSTQNMMHWSQQCEGGNKLSYYDYGSVIENYKHYKQFKPPEYDLSKFTVPTYAFLGGLDWLVTPPDGEAVVKDLPNVIWTKLLSDFNHVDFVWGDNIADTVYRDVLEILES